MPENIYLQNYNIPEDGVLVEYRTTGEYTPAHWHDSLELVYILNGNATIYLEGSEHKLVPGEFIVIDTNQIHEARCTRTYMMIVVRIDDDLIQRLMGNKRNFQIICSRAELTDELPADHRLFNSFIQRRSPRTEPQSAQDQRDRFIHRQALYGAAVPRTDRGCLRPQQRLFQPHVPAEHRYSLHAACQPRAAHPYLPRYLLDRRACPGGARQARLY